MLIRLVEVIALVVVVEGGWPQCITKPETCYEKIHGDFAYAIRSASSGKNPHSVMKSFISMGEDSFGELCNRENWNKRESCTHCPLRVVISDPPDLQMEVCAKDNIFDPFVPDAHIDMYHKLNGQKLELLLSGNTDEQNLACSPTDLYDGKNYTGKMVVSIRGTCFFFEKGKNAAQAGASASIIMNPNHALSRDWRIPVMAGRSNGLGDMPSVAVHYYRFDRIVKALKDGIKVTGSIQLSCSQPESYHEYVDLDCPLPYFVSMCNMPRFSSQNRLCSKCTFTVEMGGKDVCIWGNDLFPRKKRNHILRRSDYPSLPFETDMAVYIPHDGCDLSMFNSNLKDKFVFIDIEEKCFLNAIHAIQEVGVAGVFLCRKDNRPFEFPSENLKIPFHRVNASNYSTVIDFSLKNGKLFKLSPDYEAHELPSLVVKEWTVDLPFVHLLPAEQPPSHIRLKSSDFIWSFAVIFCIVLFLLLSVAFIVRHVRQPKSTLGKSASRNTIPLSSASAMLSVTLLLTMAASAFALSYNSGLEIATTTKTETNVVVRLSHANAAENIRHLNELWRSVLLEDTVLTTASFFETGSRLARSLASAYVSYNGTWDSFHELFFIQHSLKFNWLHQIKMKNGFFASKNVVSDFVKSPEANKTENGYDCGLLSTTVHDNGILTYKTKISKTQYNPMRVVAGEYRNPFDTIAGVDMGGLVYVQNSYNILFMAEADISRKAPLTIATPIYTALSQTEPVGVIEVHRGSRHLSDAIISSIKSSPEAENITFFIAHRTTGAIIANSYSTIKHIDMFPFSANYRPATELYTLFNIAEIQQRALGMKLYNAGSGSFGVGFKQLSGGSHKMGGLFDQKDYYKETVSNVILKFDFEMTDEFGRIIDRGPEHWKAENRDGSCSGSSCLHEVTVNSHGPKGNRAMHFDGKSILYIYQNLTTDTPRIASSRIQANPWQSTSTAWNKSMTYSDGTEVLIFSEDTSKTPLPIVREAWYLHVFSISLWMKPSGFINDSHTPDETSPILYSDAEFSENRIYANGMWWLGVQYFGCATDPIPGGPPPDEWTHIFATLRSEGLNSFCEVYINGHLHSEKRLAPMYGAAPNAEPNRLGVHYEGLIDDFIIFNDTFNPEEISQFYKTGIMKRSIRSREWTYDVCEFNFGPHQFLIGLMIPAEDILRRLNKDSAALVNDLMILDRNTYARLDQLIVEAVLIVMVSVLASVLIFLLCNDFLTKPFSSFANRLTAVAAMRLDNHQPQKTFIREIHKLEEAMETMMTNIQEYKNYVPKDLFIAVEVDYSSDKISSSEESSLGTSTGSVTPGQPLNLSSSRSEPLSNMKQVQELRSALELSLVKKKVSFLVVNISHFQHLVESLTDASLIETHGTYISTTLVTIVLNKGTPDSFSGDRILATFNAVRPVPTHRQAACKSLVVLKNKLQECNATCTLTFTAAIASGDSKVGNIGSDTMKKFTCISNVVSWVYALERVAKKLRVPNLIDTGVYEDVKTFFTTRHTAMVFYNKRSEKQVRVSTLIRCNEVALEEWMYTLARNEERDPYVAWNIALEAVFSGDWETATSFFRRPAVGIADESTVRYFQRCCSVKDYFPINVLFN